MKRYQGEALPPTAKVALLSNDALGNYVVATPLIQALKQRWPQARLEYFGGTRTQELWECEDLIDAGYALFGSSPRDSAEALREPFDLVINLEASPWAMSFAALAAGAAGACVGPCVADDGRGELPYAPDDRGRLWTDPEWVAEDLPSRYPFLHSGFIGEIFLRLCYLQGPLPKYRLPRAEVRDPLPEVLIATAASLPEKLWPVEHWIAMVERIRRTGRQVGLLGASPAAQQRFWKGASDEDRIIEAGAFDLRGRFTLPQVVEAISKVERVLTLDNGILHLAAATTTPTVGLFRYGIHRLWAPPVATLRVLVPPNGEAVSRITLAEVEHALGF